MGCDWMGFVKILLDNHPQPATLIVTMRTVLGIAMIIVGIILGLYVGVWLMFVGGIVDLVNAVNASRGGVPMDGVAIGIGVVKIVFASLAGVVSAFALIVPGCKIASRW